MSLDKAQEISKKEGKILTIIVTFFISLGFIFSSFFPVVFSILGFFMDIRYPIMYQNIFVFVIIISFAVSLCIKYIGDYISSYKKLYYLPLIFYGISVDSEDFIHLVEPVYFCFFFVRGDTALFVNKYDEGKINIDKEFCIDFEKSILGYTKVMLKQEKEPRNAKEQVEFSLLVRDESTVKKDFVVNNLT